MKKKFTVALIGRPNVGKSSVFNSLCKKRIAIVEETEGVTRDRIATDICVNDQLLTIIDTGGIDADAKIPYATQVKEQSCQAIVEADAIIFLVDGQMGITQLDMEIAKTLRKAQKPVILAVNKIDGFSSDLKIHNFHGLGFSTILPVSAKRHRNLKELIRLCLVQRPMVPDTEQMPEAESVRVAIIGRPNVGKSTLLNFLVKQPRCVVSSEAGTTRDAIDMQVSWQNSSYIFIDTAGIRRKQKEKSTLEKFASMRTWEAIERAQVCILMLDSTQGMTQQEKRIAREIEKKGKGCILFFNKWDCNHGLRMEHASKAIRLENPFFNHCPIFFGSAKTGRNVDKIFATIDQIATNLTTRIPTGKINQTITKVMQAYHPPMIQGKRLRIYYMTQVDVNPPHFVLFINYKNLMTESYKKYLINQFRKQHDFLGCPLHIDLREKDPQQAKNMTMAHSPSETPETTSLVFEGDETYLTSIVP